MKYDTRYICVNTFVYDRDREGVRESNWLQWISANSSFKWFGNAGEHYANVMSVGKCMKVNVVVYFEHEWFGNVIVWSEPSSCAQCFFSRSFYLCLVLCKYNKFNFEIASIWNECESCNSLKNTFTKRCVRPKSGGK